MGHVKQSLLIYLRISCWYNCHGRRTKKAASGVIRSYTPNQCFSIAGAKRNVGGVCRYAQVGEAAALCNRATGKKAVQILASALG